MREFFREIVHALEAGQPAELVSVAASEGSTPRGAGAMMAVFPGGRTIQGLYAPEAAAGKADGFPHQANIPIKPSGRSWAWPQIC